MTRRIFTALLGLAAGLVTAPLALIAWPLICAWFMWDEARRREV